MEQQHSRLAPISRSIFSTLTAAIISMPLYATAADFGVLKGTITDRNDGEPVIGASVMLENTTIGAASDFDGNYSIMEIPAGTYSLKVSGVGYAPLVQKVTVPAGETATLNLKLAETTIMASEVIVGAALYEQDRLEVPVTVSVVSDEKIKEEPSQSLDQVIEDVPGVNLSRSAGNSNTTVQIRGSNTFQGGLGTRVQGLYDGFPINLAETGEVVWNNINMNAADKVEVMKGAAATLYGSGAMGGVVNVFGHLPDKCREIKAGVSGGFYDGTPDSDHSNYREGFTPWMWNGYVGFGEKCDDVSYSFLYTHNENDGYKENSWSSLDDVKLKIRYDIDSDQYIQLSSFYNESRGGYTTIWPYDIEFVTGPAFISFSDRGYDLPDSVYADDTIKRKNALVGLNYVNLLSDDLSLDARAYYTYNKTRFEYNPTDETQEYVFSLLVSPFPPPFGTTIDYALYSREAGEFNETSSNRFGGGFKFDWRASDQHRLLFGLDANIIDVESTQYTPNLTDTNELSSVTERNFALFVQDEFKMTDRLTALLSLRYDWSGIDAHNVTYTDFINPIYGPPPGPGAPPSILGYNDVTVPIENESVDALSPRIALNYKATDDMSFRASWGKSFRAPSLAERFVRDAGVIGNGIPNPELDKETMTAYEIGMFKQFSDKVSFDIAAYLNNYDNLIESRTLEPTALQVFQYQNVAKARIWGIETSLNVKPTTDWNLNFAYAYMNAKDKSDEPAALAPYNPDPDWLAYRPEHTASVSATWNATDRLTLNTTGRYVSEYKAVSSFYAANVDGDDYPGGFVVFNAGAKYKITDNLTGTLLCKNITNEQYEEAEWFRAPGRSYVFGMDFVF